MKRTAILVLAASAALASVAYGQVRHDDRPHGVTKPQLLKQAAAASTLPGRHDERPHGVKKADEKKQESSGASQASK